jgi:hypothetical protein
MPHLEYTLDRLALTFAARDIMVRRKDLVCAPDEASARRLLEEKPDFDVIPIEHKGALSAYLERGSERQKPILLRDVISDATSILELVDILQERRFVFVLVQESVGGYIHLSDLNNQIVKLPFFVILEALEHRLAHEVGPFINQDNLEAVLDAQRARTVKAKMRDMKARRADLGWVNLLSFDEIVRFACHLGKVHLEGQQTEAISRTRNTIYHATRALVEKPRDVRRLAEAKTICVSVLKDIMAQESVG